jgi:hypothetical protein
VVEHCKEAFQKYMSFAAMPREEREFVAGTRGGQSGFLGSMKGAGYFKQFTISYPGSITGPIDLISLNGEITREETRRYLAVMLGFRGIRFGAATRLLTAKRPDQFLPINHANEQRVRQIFGYAPATAAGYVRLQQTIWDLPWYQSRAPEQEDELRVWQARVGLMDALLYEA